MPPPTYLLPYLKAVNQHGAKFESLLWANPSSQASRFAAFARWCELKNRTLLDAGCGRADFLDYLRSHQIIPARYIGIEAVTELADAAGRIDLSAAEIIHGDFVENPKILDRNADVIIFSGSLNTLSVDDFYKTLQQAWTFTQSVLAFNFLCSPRLASAKHLTWQRRSDVLEFAHSLTSDVAVDSTYREGDCTVVIRKTQENF